MQVSNGLVVQREILGGAAETHSLLGLLVSLKKKHSHSNEVLTFSLNRSLGCKFRLQCSDKVQSRNQFKTSRRAQRPGAQKVRRTNLTYTEFSVQPGAQQEIPRQPSPSTHEDKRKQMQQPKSGHKQKSKNLCLSVRMSLKGPHICLH